MNILVLDDEKEIADLVELMKITQYINFINQKMQLNV